LDFDEADEALDEHPNLFGGGGSGAGQIDVTVVAPRKLDPDYQTPSIPIPKGRLPPAGQGLYGSV
jgi:hypothetical protein